MNYKIKKSNKKEPLKTTIEETGSVNVFEISAILIGEENLMKRKKEIEGNISILRAKIENIKTNYPKIVEMFSNLEPKEKVAAGIYAQTDYELSNMLPQINEVERISKQYKDLYKEIKKQTKIDIEELKNGQTGN